MRVAHVNVFFYPLMFGGVEWYIFNISRELVKKGHEVHVFTTAQNDLTAEDEVQGIQIHRLPLLISLSYRLKIWSGLSTALKGQEFDIIHVYDYAQFQNFVALNVGKEMKIPVVTTIYDLHSLIPRPFYKQFPMYLYDRFLSKRMLNSFEKILVRTQSLATYLSDRLEVKKGRIEITPPGVVEEAFQPFDGESFRRKYGIDGSMILYVGRLHPTKGLQHLIRAAPAVLEQVRDTKIVFVGPDQVNYKRTLVKLAEDLGISNSVIFLGPIYDLAEKMGAYASCDVFVLPSGYEGFGQVIIEAFTQQKPVVATRVGGVPDLIEDGDNGLLVDYGDTRDLAKSISKILLNKNLAENMGRRGRRTAEAFKYRVLAEQLEEIYLNVTRSFNSSSVSEKV